MENIIYDCCSLTLFQTSLIVIVQEYVFELDRKLFHPCAAKRVLLTSF